MLKSKVMKNTAITIIFCTILAGAIEAAGQSRLEFEVATVKAMGEDTQQVSAGVKIDGAQVRATFLTLKDYIAIAYRTRLQQIETPEWTAQQRFEIAAKLPDGGSPSQVPEMLQSLLADRFALKLHKEAKELPVYALEVATSGLRIKEVPPETAPDGATSATVDVAASGSAAGVSVSFGKGAYYSFADNKFEIKHLTTTQIAESLARFLDRPIVDMTGLKGKYDFVLEVTPEDYRAMLIRSALTAGVVLPPQALRLLDFNSSDSLFAAVEKLGLKLTAKKAPLDVLVVDSVQKLTNN